MNINGRECHIYENGDAEYVLLQPVDDNDIGVLDSEVQKISELTDASFILVAFKINDWNSELTPWDAPAVFGNHDFGHGAEATLDFLQNELLPAIIEKYDVGKIPVILGGYSLAAFFTLWVSYQSHEFSAVASASPSVWYPGWIDYASDHKPHAKKVYLSLGDREEKTRNIVMSTVGDCIRKQYEILKRQLGDEHCTLEWNRGNHFADSDLRCAKAFAWCMNDERRY